MNNEVTDNNIQTESTRIKLVIDISKEVYEDIKYNFNKQNYCSCGEYLISSMIVFGTPLEELEKKKTEDIVEELEKIKAEIQSIIVLADSREEDTKLAYQCQIVIDERISELKNDKIGTGVYWIHHEIEDTLRWYECSKCHKESYTTFKYCPHCGSIMGNLLKGENK